MIAVYSLSVQSQSSMVVVPMSTSAATWGRWKWKNSIIRIGLPQSYDNSFLLGRVCKVKEDTYPCPNVYSTDHAYTAEIDDWSKINLLTNEKVLLLGVH